MVSHLEQVRQKIGPCDFDQIFELQSLSKTVFTVSLASKLQNQLISPQQYGTSLNGIGSEFIFFVIFFLLLLVSFTVDDDLL